VVQIIDSGTGIPPAVRDRLFDPFITTKAVGKGTGLGLSISRNIIVQHHGGTIDVVSEPGRTCFEVRLPLDAHAECT
jgi:signal transduction histidine kinase